MPRSLATARVSLATGVIYAALSWGLTESTSFGVTVGAVFWPGAGLTVAVLLWRPRREWPLILGAVAIAEFAMDMYFGFGVWRGLGWAVANTAEPALAAWLLTRHGERLPDLADLGSLARFTAAAVFLGPALGALIGTAAGVIGAGDSWWPRLPRWWIGDGIGVLAVAPILLVVLGGRWTLPRARAILPLGLLAALVTLALGPWEFSADWGLPFLVLPAVALVAVRLRTPGAALAIVVVALVADTVTAMGAGPFTPNTAFDGLVVAQMFLAMTAFTGLAVAALVSDLVTRSEVEAILREQAFHDELTGLPNRRLLVDRIESASRQMARQPGLLTLLFLDLDDFKAINDTFGHAAGDQVLLDTGRRLRLLVRDVDSVARIGGDEFVVLATVGGPDDAQHLAERVLAAFDAPFAWEHHTIAVRPSIGMVTADAPVPDVERFLGDADRSMYDAKREGGGRVAKEPGRTTGRV